MSLEVNRSVRRGDHDAVGGLLNVSLGMQVNVNHLTLSPFTVCWRGLG